ncbi:MAG TPA: helix-turn-helix domain-containing protein [Thermoanaerobaculia bacterium]|nr:helix-turn-helix domain-containing protein [Thermoanaerobaculia bacterium]
MAKIAVELERALHARRITGEPGCATGTTLAEGDGWRVTDVICTSGPDDRPFEERHSSASISIVAAGSFEYRSHSPADLLTPGSFLLGTPDQLYQCAHHHASGDRCIAFQFAPEFFETIVESPPRFRAQRLPPLREAAPLVARAFAGLAMERGRPARSRRASRSATIGAHDPPWEELALEIAAKAIHLANDINLDHHHPPPTAVARVTQAVRTLEESPASLRELANHARLSPYHFLRTFTRITGVTPHQFALRMRLRDAAVRLATDDARVIDVAFDSGFGDVSNFNRAFRAEFGVSPRAYRNVLTTTAGPTSSRARRA